MTDAWISAETQAKEADFRGILDMHVTICKGIFARNSLPPYLYVDLYAGPGNLEYRGACFDGSPLIAQQVLTKAGINSLAVHYEQDPAVAARLAAALWVPTSLVDEPDEETAPIYPVACQDGFPQWLDRQGRQLDRYGLIYSDPIRDEIPYELLNKAAYHFPKVDLLSYVSATQYKRRRGADADKPYLIDHIQAVDKRVVLIRKPIGMWHWTFILWSNWTNLPEWEKRGFHRLDSHRGKEIMDELNFSKREHHAMHNDPLFGGV
jgi:hypothetical protein